MVEDDEHLGEANILGILTEALTAHVESVLADKAPLIGAHTAAEAKAANSDRRDGPSPKVDSIVTPPRIILSSPLLDHQEQHRQHRQRRQHRL